MGTTHLSNKKQEIIGERARKQCPSHLVHSKSLHNWLTYITRFSHVSFYRAVMIPQLCMAIVLKITNTHMDNIYIYIDIYISKIVCLALWSSAPFFLNARLWKSLSKDLKNLFHFHVFDCQQNHGMIEHISHFWGCPRLILILLQSSAKFICFFTANIANFEWSMGSANNPSPSSR